VPLGIPFESIVPVRGFFMNSSCIVVACAIAASTLQLAGSEPPAASPLPTFLDDVSLWHSEVNLHEDHTKFAGRYIDGLVIGNGAMLAVEGMTTEITRFEKSRLTDSRLHGLCRFDCSGNGFIEHLSRSPKVPLHALTWVAGPVYTEVPAAYGFTFGAEYLAHGKARVIEPDGWNRERQYRVRRTNIVKNVVESEDLRVIAVDFMLPERPALIRQIQVSNIGTESVEHCRFSIKFRVDPRNWTGLMAIQPAHPGGSTAEPAQAGNEVDFYQRHVRRAPRIAGREVERSILIEVPPSMHEAKNQLMLISSPEKFATADKQFFEFDLGRLVPGAVRAFSIEIVMTFDETEMADTLEQITTTSPERLLREAHASWIARLDAADRLAVPLRKDLAPATVDYLDGLRTFLLSLHARTGGCIAHPYSYNQVYFRDAYDTFRAMLTLGHREECRKTILFFKEAMHRLGIRMKYTPEEFHWAPASQPSRIGEVYGFEDMRKSEYMLFFPMLVRDYTERFGDEDLAQSVYAEMKRALTSQPVDGEGLIAYSGDEISVKRGPPRYPYSPQNAALYARAAEFVAATAKRLGYADAAAIAAGAQKVRATTERRFWNEQGFYAYSADDQARVDARVNVFSQALPFFYGYLSRDDVRLRPMIASVKRENMFPSHRVATLPIAGKKFCGNNGNTIGLLLYLMSLAGDPEAAQVFDRMLGDVGTMGTTGEYLTVSDDSITRGEMLRSYETSFNLCATLEFLRAK
jgi:hypothetical protein